jgi:elongation factor Ts
MQAAAMSPIALDEAGVDAATIEKIEIAKDLFVKKVSQKQC